MKLLFCITPQTDDSPTVATPVNKKNDSSSIRHWFNSCRGMKIRKRVAISNPINDATLSKDDLIHHKGFVDNIKLPNAEKLIDFVDATAADVSNNHIVVPKEDDSNNDAVDSVDCVNKTAVSLVNAETNTESSPIVDEGEEEKPAENNNYIDYTCPKKEMPIYKNNIEYGWYWGNVSRREAENLLRGKEDGTFLVRESSDKRFLYSLTFRSNGKTMHTRIETNDGMFSFYSAESDSKRSSSGGNDGSSTLGGLITDAMNHNNTDGIFFYSRGMHSDSSLHTVTLCQPLSRHQYLIDYDYDQDETKSLSYLCKFIIHHSSVARNKFNSQFDVLPEQVKQFVENPFYYPSIKKSKF